MQKLYSIILLSAIAVHGVSAQTKQQKKDYTQARINVKGGKDLDNTIKTLTRLLDESEEMRTNEKVYVTWYEAVEKLYAQGNEKLYLREQYDTAKLFNYAKEMFMILERLDSIAAGKVTKEGAKVEYRNKHAQTLNTYRPNLFFGGSFFLRKNDYQTAFDFFDTYIDCANQPIFSSSYDYLKNDTLMPAAAYLATHCGYHLSDADKTLKHVALAQRDNAHLCTTTQYIAEAYRMRNDTTQYLATLRRGFRQFTTHPYFFTYLQDWYAKNNMHNEALQLCDDALQQDSTSLLVLMSKANTLLNMERNKECIAVCNKVISLNDSIAEAHFYAGTAYLNEALKIEDNIGALRKNKAKLKKIYQHALPYMEKYRGLRPDEKQRWAPALYRIYLNLNMGRKFEEIDKIISEE